MSNKLKQSLAAKPKTVVIDEMDMKFLNDIDTIQRSFAYYHEQLKSNYLYQVASKFGFSITDKLGFSIDLRDEKRELTVKKLPEDKA